MVGIKKWLIYKILREFKYFCLSLIRSFSGFIFRIKVVTKEHRSENKLGIETTGCVKFKDKISLCKDESPYQPTPYDVIEKMANNLPLSPDDVFVDLGCGKGRVVFFMAAKRLKKVVGIELYKDIADIARVNLKNLRLNNTPVEIIDGDVSNLDLKDGTIFFMFNPFGRDTAAKVVENIKNSLINNPRRIRIVHYGSPPNEILDNQDWLVSDGSIGNAPVFIWHNR